MDHADHVALLRPGVDSSGGTWADLGAGSGAFTLALAELLGPGTRIHAVDRDEAALQEATAQMERRFPGVELTVHVADFSGPLPFPPASLDGLLMANSLHFVRVKAPVLRAAMATIRPGGPFLLVEYGSDQGSPWVPWPISYPSWERLAERVGLRGTRRIGQVPSRFLGSIYAAASEMPGGGAAGPRRGC
jgi:ubiquinone/menaquinone biosynthesis C-methylase UbiE